MKQEILLNRYKVLEKLGEGGMGVVWKVYDEVEKKEVALKEIKTKSGEERLPTGSMLGSRVETAPTVTLTSEPKLRFAEEFRTMRMLQYPYTVKVFDYGVLENGNRYFTMEIVAGTNLKEILKKRKLDFQEIYKILIQLAQTLNFIHSRLYVHRDIKSNNIMITKDGNVKLMDFGLMDRIGVTSEGTMTGTVYYIPPEVLKGGVINESSDLYSLGILGYELTTGNFPFQGEKEMDIIRMHMKTPPKPLVKSRPDTPPDFERIISKLLEKEQDDRYQTSPELIEDLSRLSGEEITVETLEEKKSYLYCSKLIGREEETNQLREAFEKMKKGEGQSIFIGAPAGVGKSRLLQEFKIESQLSEVTFLEGFCIEHGMSTYQPFREALRPVVPMIKRETLDKYGEILVKIIPELEGKGYKPVQPLDELGEKLRIYDAVTSSLKEMSETNPLIICFEDLHWSDSASIDLLNNCIRKLQRTQIMFVCTFRDDEIDGTSSILYTIKDENTEFMKLSLLNESNTFLLIQAMLGKIEFPDEFIDQIFSATAGNPFFVAETMRSLIEDEQIKLIHGKWVLSGDLNMLNLPTSIDETITRRLQLLEENELNFIQMSSVMGRELDLSILETISDIDKEKLFSIIDKLIEKQFIKKEQKRCYFTHDRVRETLYDQLDENRKTELHEIIGNQLEEKNIKNITNIIDLLGYHFSKGLDKQKAVKYLILAADKSEQKANIFDFTEKYYQALSLLEKVDYPDKEKVFFEAGYKLITISYATEPDICSEIYRKVLTMIYELSNGEEKLKKRAKIFQTVYKIINLFPKRIAEKIKEGMNKEYPPYAIPKKKDYPHIISKLVEINCYKSISSYQKGEFDKVISIVEDTINNLLPEKHSLDYACILPCRASAFNATGRFKRAHRETEEAISIMKKYRDKLNKQQVIMFCVAWFWHNNAHMNLCDLTDEDSKSHLKIAEENKLYDHIGWSYVNELIFLAFKGRHSQYRVVEDKLIDFNKRIGSPKGMEYWLKVWQAYHYLWRGEFEKVDRHLQRAKLLLMSEVGQDVCYFKMVYVMKYIEQGQIDKGLPLLEEYVVFCEENNLDALVEAYSYLAEVYTSIGRLEDALPILEKGKERALSDDYWNPRGTAFIYKAYGSYYLANRKFEEAEKSYKESLRIANDLDLPLLEGMAYQKLGVYYIELTQYAKARESIEKAIAKFKEIDNQYQLKKVELAQNKLMELTS